MKTAAERIESLRIEGWVTAGNAYSFVSRDGTEVAVVLPDGHYFRGQLDDLPGDEAQQWTREWPTKPGVYWFYGWPYGKSESGARVRAPEWNLVKVMKCSNGVITVRDGSPWYRHEGWDGMFCEADRPAVPRGVQ